MELLDAEARVLPVTVLLSRLVPSPHNSRAGPPEEFTVLFMIVAAEVLKISVMPPPAVPVSLTVLLAIRNPVLPNNAIAPTQSNMLFAATRLSLIMPFDENMKYMPSE